MSLKQLVIAVFRSSAIVSIPTLYFQRNGCHFLKLFVIQLEIMCVCVCIDVIKRRKF